VSAQSTGTTFLAASNTEPAFDFMTQNFVQTANGGNSVTFSFAGSGHLAGEIDGGVDYASDIQPRTLPQMAVITTARPALVSGRPARSTPPGAS